MFVVCDCRLTSGEWHSALLFRLHHYSLQSVRALYHHCPTHGLKLSFVCYLLINSNMHSLLQVIEAEERKKKIEEELRRMYDPTVDSPRLNELKKKLQVYTHLLNKNVACCSTTCIESCE